MVCQSFGKTTSSLLSLITVLETNTFFPSSWAKQGGIYTAFINRNTQLFNGAWPPLKEILWSLWPVQLPLVQHTSNSRAPARPASGGSTGEMAFCCWGSWVVTVSLHTLESWTTECRFPQLDRSSLERCGWNLPKSKPHSDMCLDIAAASQGPARRHPQPWLFQANPPLPWTWCNPYASGKQAKSGCRMTLFALGGLRHPVCIPLLTQGTS